MQKNFWKYHIISSILTLGMDSIGYLPAHRDSLVKAVKLIKEGNVVVIFPEGRRNPKKILNPGKRGAAVIALLSGCLIVPAGSFGPPTYGVKQGFIGLFKTKSVRFGKPFQLPQKTQTEINKNPFLLIEATNRIMTAIAEQSNKIYQQVLF